MSRIGVARLVLVHPPGVQQLVGDGVDDAVAAVFCGVDTWL
jgi:hypothetical protein